MNQSTVRDGISTNGPRIGANDSARGGFDYNGVDAIPVSEWDHDHWSTLAYIETRCVDADGVIDNDRMRCNWRRHRKLVGPRQLQSGADGAAHPTRLAAGVLCRKHDDWDCLNDMVAAGFVEIVDEEDRRPAQAFGGMRVTVRMTEAGMRAASDLRAHKASGGSFGTFAVSGDADSSEKGDIR